MTIVIAGNILQKSDGLSEPARQALSFIDGGQQWLAWAMASPTIFHETADETTFLTDVQHGLHASPMTFLPRLGLSVSPVKLLSLGSDNMRTLMQAEDGDTSTAVLLKVQQILNDHGLLGGDKLRRSCDFLEEIGVASSPLFQMMDFNDRVAVHSLATSESNQAIGNSKQSRQEAAAFAVQQARTVIEFCDYYQVYLAYLKKTNVFGGSASERNQLCSQAMQTVLPLAFSALECPRLPDRLPSPDEVERRLRDWLVRGRRLGFSRLSQAVLQIVTQTNFSTETGNDARRLFELYFNGAQSFLTTVRFHECLLGQDGENVTFSLQSATQRAVLNVSANRTLSLHSFGNLSAVPADVLVPGNSNALSSDQSISSLA
jgi:hypothetical protein